MTDIRRFALTGFVAGIALAAAGLLLAPSGPEATSSTTTSPLRTDSTRTGPWWFSPAETQIGPTAILMESVEVDDGDVVVRYEIRDLAPSAIGRMRTLEESNPFFAQPRDEPVVAPERWVLETVNGEYEGFSPSARTPAARFEVPDGFVLGTITGLRLESYRMRMPYVFDLEVSTALGATYELDEGFSFTVVRILPQSTTTIIHIDYATPSDDFTAGEPTPVIISGIGPEWLSYNQRQAGESLGGLQLVRAGDDLPATIPLRVRTTYWTPFETSIDIDLGGMRFG